MKNIKIDMYKLNENIEFGKNKYNKLLVECLPVINLYKISKHKNKKT